MTERLNWTALIFIQLNASKLLSLSEFLKNKLATFHQDLPLLATVSCFFFLEFHSHQWPFLYPCTTFQYVLTTLICYCLFSISCPGMSLFIQCFYSYYLTLFLNSKQPVFKVAVISFVLSTNKKRKLFKIICLLAFLKLYPPLLSFPEYHNSSKMFKIKF